MSAPEWRRNEQLFTALDTTDTTLGIYVGRAGEMSRVNVGESTVEVRASTRYRPVKGEPVVLTWVNSRLRLTGPARARSSEGVVTAVANPWATVTCEDRSYRMPMAISVAEDLAAGDAVAIDWDYRGGYVKDKLTVAGGEDPAEPRLTLDQKRRTLSIFAKQSGSYKTFKGKGDKPDVSRWWTEDVYADEDNVAGWFYGPTIRHSLRNDAHILSVEVFLSVRTTKGLLPEIGRHTQAERPKESLSVSDEKIRLRRAGWVQLPNEWAEDWRDHDGGVAISHGGTTVYKGIHADRQSGKLRIRVRQ